MKKLLNSIRYDIKLNIYNKSICFLMLLAVLIFLVVNYNMLEKFKGNLSLYNHTYAEMLENGENIEILLKQEVNVTEETTDDGAVLQYIDNPLRYDHDNLIKSLTCISKTNIFVGLTENATLVFLGLLFGIYMIFLVTYEFSEQTIKTRLLIDAPTRVLLSKLLSGIFVVTLVFFSSLLISGGISYVWASCTLNAVDIDVKPIIFSFGQVTTSNMNINNA